MSYNGFHSLSKLQTDIFLTIWVTFSQVMKTYHMYHAESISAESKLKEAEKQEEKQIGRSSDPVFHIRLEERHQRRSSVKKIEKMKEKRQAKYSENKLKSIKARNEYLLTLEATNASVFKYYIHDLSDLIDIERRPQLQQDGPQAARGRAPGTSRGERARHPLPGRQRPGVAARGQWDQQRERPRASPGPASKLPEVETD
ncbi:hypothetical protein J1605_008629 [Eschrichtius robustus]|uniref:SLIT-ROBO Rho GTPase-activating protein 1 n=1 Tax=Eschrichtius robustus TaxID=9764 RepID=A0AB34GVS0_ESCRO|nr:hypothetical protein J1605_008629 [Eschrichtius robustus]